MEEYIAFDSHKRYTWVAPGAVRDYLSGCQQNGTLPTVWIPPGPLRDLRELTRTRLVLVAQRTRLFTA